MKTVIDILLALGGFDAFMCEYGGHIKVEPPGAGYMPLVIEEVGPAPHSKYSIAVGHFYVQNGDVMYDPEMTFEITGDWTVRKNWHPIRFRMSNPPVDRLAIWTEDGKVQFNPAEVKDELAFARVWDRNLKEQGFLRQWKAQLKAPRILKMPEPLPTTPLLDDDDLPDLIELED